MKKILLLSMLLPFAWSCGEKPANDPEPDAGFDICLFVDNPRVGNILAPEFRDELLACGVTLTHNGETYPLEWPETPSAESTGGRGFRIEPYDPGIDETPVLRFGKFVLSEEGFRGETFDIDWGESEMLPDEVVFDFYRVDRNPGSGSSIVIKVWINGVLTADGAPETTIVKEPMTLLTDYANMDMNIFVKNATGENLLDPAVGGNLRDNAITIEYRNEVWPLSTQSTRASGPPDWKGLRIEPYIPGVDETPVLRFGEFPTGGEGCHGEEFTIDWADGTANEMKFDCHITHPETSPVTGKIIAPARWTVRIWVDGELQSGSPGTGAPLTVEIVK